MNENRPPSRIAVVGGGITGLATAYFLQTQARTRQQPLEVFLIEAGPRLGGKVRTEREDGFLVEGGPDAFLTTKPWALRLCQELGLTDQMVGPQPQNHKTFVLVGGRLRRLPEGVIGLVPTRFGPFLRSDLFSVWGKLRMGLDLLVPPRRDGGDESLGHFVRRRLGREALERLAEPLLAGIYAADADRLSLLATFPRFREMERQHGSLIAGTLAMRRRRPPAPTTPKAPVSRSPFRTLRPGLSALVRTLQARLREAPGVSVILGRRVVEVQRQGTGPAYRLRLAEGPAIEADAAV
ncbi:MAG: protoporphyrinogen oxidase, partial [Chloroflexi bacterium]